MDDSCPSPRYRSPLKAILFRFWDHYSARRLHVQDCKTLCAGREVRSSLPWSEIHVQSLLEYTSSSCFSQTIPLRAILEKYLISDFSEYWKCIPRRAPFWRVKEWLIWTTFLSCRMFLSSCWQNTRVNNPLSSVTGSNSIIKASWSGVGLIFIEWPIISACASHQLYILPIVPR